ncbi:MAG TPA: AAA family ATPase [Candidatus Paceibacterota bacterium]|nr:AAA family ATPase [Candidatus Paceibacterota bacterium]HRZ34501.1 AAA family ATPase [Candidatus Paceibacterota bacterium]
MYLKELEILGFKSFAKKANLKFNFPISAIVGPNGSGKSNIAEAFRFVLGEQSFKSMRGKRGEDLIFSGTPTLPRQSRASVKLVFDNSRKILPVDFEDVTLERIVHRDGINQYIINGSEVRLKDLIELLASANIGSSGHHIISQGEADRILSSSPKERKTMLEDALGLKIFQYKKVESERKLIKTEENIKQVQSLRREIAPHIKFLKKQVEKIEEGEKLKGTLLTFYKEYLKTETEYLKSKKAELGKNIDGPQKRLREIATEIAAAEKLTQNQTHHDLTIKIKDLENQISSITKEKEDLLKEDGRIEGQLSSLTRLIEKQKAEDKSVSLTKSELNEIKNKIEDLDKESAGASDVAILREVVKKIINFVKEFLISKIAGHGPVDEMQAEVEKCRERKEEINSALDSIKNRESFCREEIKNLRQKLDQDKSSSLAAEKKIVTLMSEKNDIQQEISKHSIAIDTLNRDETAFKQELTEAVVLVGREVLNYESAPISVESPEISREEQLEKRKKLERLKIRVEESAGGVVSEDVLREYKDASERDEFLAREIEDLEKSSISLKSLIEELGQKIETKFHEGVAKINNEFQKFFELMFGGGTAGIKVIKTEIRRRKETDLSFDEGDLESAPEEEEEPEEGIDIKVNLPRKKINGLMMLSGGERALTSIALLFAISQVNPPPFIILDETDAALDEANSRKYGDMIENLSKSSQLILITHNRETMSRAGVLYGVTMIGGASQLLSVAFDEGTQWAK